MPYRPSSCAVWRVKPICPALALAYAWMPGQADAAPGTRRDVDDPSVAALLHPGCHRAGADERARQVRVDHGPPVVVAHVLERPSDLADDAACVVDEDVDAADLRDEGGDLLGVAHVDRVAVAAVHGRAVRLERGGDPAADAVRGAGDDRDAA